MRAFVILLSAFLATIWLSTRLYAGGMFFDKQAEGFDFWGNFWCDLLHEQAFDGADNSRAMWSARIAFWLFAAALIRFWTLAGALTESMAVRRWCFALGTFSAVTLTLVTMFSSADEPLLHAVFVVSSALLGVLAATVLSLAMFARADVITRALSLAMIVSALGNVGQYVSQGMGLVRHARWLGGTQKITTVLLIMFMLRCAWLLHARTLPRES